MCETVGDWTTGYFYVVGLPCFFSYLRFASAPRQVCPGNPWALGLSPVSAAGTGVRTLQSFASPGESLLRRASLIMAKGILPGL